MDISELYGEDRSLSFLVNYKIHVCTDECFFLLSNVQKF